MAGKWTVLVVLDVPQTPGGMHEELAQAYQFVIDCPVEAQVKGSWRNRLDMISQSLSPDPTLSISASDHRSRRGLLDPIGTLVHNIFGLATDAEVADIKRVIGTLHTDDEAIVHRMDEFTTIINRTRTYEQDTRTFVNAMSRRFQKVNTWLAELQDDVNGITLMVNFERILEDLELKAHTLHQLHQLYSHRRQDLHSGRLTEELLSVPSLTTILSSVRSFEASPLPDLNWYYSHTIVRPMWAATNFLVYEVLLHLVKPEAFLLYRIQTWPTPLFNQTAAQIREHGDFGYNTANGDLFVATSCLGTEPKVCESGPLYSDGTAALPCIRGILTSNARLTGKCKIDISTQTQTIIYPLQDNEYVVSSFGESLTTRCLGRSAIQTKIQQGIHQIHVNHSCSISGTGWLLSSILQKSLKVRLISRQLWRPRPMNLSAILSPLLHNNHSPAAIAGYPGSYPALAALDPLPLDVWTAPLLHTPHWHTQTPTWVWVLVTLGVLALTLLIAYCMFLRYPCPRLSALARTWKHGRFKPRVTTNPCSALSALSVAEASAPQSRELQPLSDPAFHEVLMASLGVGGGGPSATNPDAHKPPTYTQLRGILNGRPDPRSEGTADSDV